MRVHPAHTVSLEILDVLDHSYNAASCRMLANVDKHGGYHPMPEAERIAKCNRHLGKVAQDDEDHWTAIICNAACALWGAQDRRSNE